MRLREMLVLVDLESDVYRLGLRSRMPEAQLGGSVEPDSRGARRFPRAPGQKSQSEHYVEAFDPDRYVVNASVKENLIFGVADTEALGGPSGRSPLHGVGHRRDGPRSEARRDGPEGRRDADRPVRRSRAQQSAARAHGPDGARGDRHLPRHRAACFERRRSQAIDPKDRQALLASRLWLHRAAPPPWTSRCQTCRRRS